MKFVGNIVVYNPYKFQIDSIKIAKIRKNFVGTHCSFLFVSVGLFCFGSIETEKLSVSVKNRNKRNKRFVSDSAETSFGSIFGCFESKLVLLDTLPTVQAPGLLVPRPIVPIRLYNRDFSR